MEERCGKGKGVEVNGKLCSFATTRLRKRAEMQFLAIVLLGAAAPSALHAFTVWELDPYRVQIYYSTPAGPEWTARRDASFGDDLVRRCKATMSGVWKLTVTRAPEEITRLMDQPLHRDELEGPPLAMKPPDKLLLLRIALAPGGFSIEAREWDMASSAWGPTISRGAPSASRVAQEAKLALIAAFSPLARLEKLEADMAQVSVRAGDSIPRDVTFKLVKPGDALRLVRRVPDSQRESRGPTDWVWLTVESVDGPRATCRAHGSSTNAIRPEQSDAWIALRTSPARTASDLRLVSIGNGGRPLAGFEVFAMAPGETAPRALGLTDAEGHLRIAPDAAALRLVTIRSGGRTLTGFPLAFGLRRRVDVRLHVDDQWLRAQAVTTSLEFALTDLVAARQVLVARVQARLAERAFAAADKLVAEIRSLTTLVQFSQRLQEDQKPIFSTDPALQKQIERMFDELRSVATKHLDPSKIDVLAAEIQAGRSAGATTAAPVPPPTPEAATPTP